MKIDLAHLDRRIIYFLVLFALAAPLLFKYSVPPAHMKAGDKAFETIQKFQPKADEVVFVSLDFGPNTIAENGAQADVLIEHLFRKRASLVFFSQYVQGAAFLNLVPEKIIKKLQAENPGQKWVYGQDWVNLGYKPNSTLLIQSLPQSENLRDQFKKDARGNLLSTLPIFKNIQKFEQISMLVQVTGLVGTLEAYMQFFQKKEYRPIFVHGCTSITIPKSYNYLDSGQLAGFLEGIAGAAWYSKRLSETYSGRGTDEAILINTGLGVAHAVIIVLVILGNLSALRVKKAA